MKKVIYDVGANNGDDIPYYLLRGDIVVAVEANPVLAQEIRDRFPDELKSGRLVVENCVVTAGEETEEVDFYIPKAQEGRRGMMIPPPDSERDLFVLHKLKPKSIGKILAEHGNPHYIKIDIEGADGIILRAVLENGYRPPYISAEAHDVDVVSLLMKQGGYRAFKVVAGARVEDEYRDSELVVSETGERVRYSFPGHSAGPFGNDIHGGWISPADFIKVLAAEGLGWKDIHASNVDQTQDFDTGLYVQKRLGNLPLQKRAKVLVKSYMRWRTLRSRCLKAA